MHPTNGTRTRGADQLILSTLDTTSDTAPPLSSDDGDRCWHNAAVTVHISADDPGGSGVAGTEVRIDGGSWQPLVGGAVTVEAPADHSSDGAHDIDYRSTDLAGNVEFPELCVVRIDTVPPSTEVGGTVTVRSGAVAKLPYRVDDAEPNGGAAIVRVTLRTAAGALAKRLRLGSQAVDTWLTTAYHCRLAPGRYTYAAA